MSVVSAAAPAAIVARGVRKSFAAPARASFGRRTSRSAPAVDVLGGIDFDVRLGEMVSIVGPSGSGKSTLLHCLSGLEALDAGTVRIMGEPLEAARRARAARIRARHIGFVFQQYNLVPSLSALENAALPARLAGRSDSLVAAKAALERVGLAAKGAARPAELSGGEQQRVAIARALASGAGIVLADEPTGALDSKTAAAMLGLLRTLADDPRRAVVMVTHDLEAASLADRAVVLRDGRAVCELSAPTPARLLAAMEARK